MIVHDAAVAVTAVIAAAVAWVQVLAGLAAIVLCALPLCVGPGVRAVRARRGRQTAAGTPQGSSGDSSDAATTPSPARGRTARPVPSWAHTDDIEEAA